jgi:hypothetical protein
MATQKGKDGAPEGQTKKTLFTGEEDDVEGHKNMSKDAGPEGQTRKQTYAGGDEDDVEGHGKNLPL